MDEVDKEKSHIQADWTKCKGKNVLDQRTPLRLMEGALWKVLEGCVPWKGNSPSPLPLSLSLSQQEDVLPPNVTFMKKGTVGQQQHSYL